MSAPFRIRAPIGSVEELRQFTAECLARACLYAQHGAELADLGDDDGLETNVRKLIAVVKAAAATLRDLKAREAAEVARAHP